MKRLIIHRKKKLALAFMPYWIVIGIDKRTFMEQYNLVGDLCETISGWPISRISPDILKKYHSIENGECVQIELSDDINSAFAITPDGNLSNEIILNNGVEADGVIVYSYDLTTKGGFLKTSYPWFIETPNCRNNM